MQKLQTIRTALAVVLAAPLLAHALDSTPLSMKFEPPAPPRSSNGYVTPVEAPALPRFDGCRITVRNVDDVRPNKATVGAAILILEQLPFSVPMAATSVRSGDGRAWLQGAVDTLKDRGLPLAKGAPEGVDVALRMAQTWNGGMNLMSHVVLQASFPQAGHTEVRRYHGFGTRINGFNGNVEYMNTLNDGMQDALEHLTEDLRRACKGEPV